MSDHPESSRKDAPVHLRTLLLDHYDSFTWNLLQLLQRTGGPGAPPPIVVPHDHPWEEIQALLPQVHCIVLSAGPGSPHSETDFAAGRKLILEQREHGRPILGVCMGLQGMVASFGGHVVPAERCLHGRVNRIHHDPASSGPLFEGLPPSFGAVRYNSLVAEVASLPECLQVTALCKDPGLQEPEVMAVQHRSLPMYAVQFHPESVLSEHGLELFRNFHRIVRDWVSVRSPEVFRLDITELEAPVSLQEYNHGRFHRPQEEAKESVDFPNRPAEGKTLFWQKFPFSRKEHPGSSPAASSRVVSASVEEVFSHLFQPHPCAFWLDSSITDRTHSSSIPDAEVSEPPLPDRRFSILGAMFTPASRWWSYRSSTRRLSTRSLDPSGSGLGEPEVEILSDHNGLFELLNRNLQRLQPYTLQPFQKSQISEPPNVDEKNSDHPQSLPFGFDCGLFGHLGYEMKSETLPNSPHPFNDSVQDDNPGLPDGPSCQKIPDAQFILCDRLCVFDHQEQMYYLLALSTSEQDGDDGEGGSGSARSWMDDFSTRLLSLRSQPTHSTYDSKEQDEAKPLDWKLQFGKDQYEGNVKKCLQHIRKGSSYELCLTHQITTKLPSSFDPLAQYKKLRRNNPAPYAVYFNFPVLDLEHPSTDGPDASGSNPGSVHVLCSSPERLLKISSDAWVTCKPIKGTRRRGRDPEEDLRLIEELRTSEKDRAENLMIADLIRNDLTKVCEVDSVHCPALMCVETYASVHQLVTTVAGRLDKNVSSVDALRAVFPAGSMTGAPKLRSTEILGSIEKSHRSLYSGCIGYLGLSGAADFNVVIRTAVCTEDRSGDWSSSIGAGGAIIIGSDPTEEFEEMLLKARAVRRAVEAN